MREVDQGWGRVLRGLEREASREAGGTYGFPHYSDSSRWVRPRSDQLSSWRGDVYEHGNWTYGFWYGVMWLAARLTSKPEAAELARSRLGELEVRAKDRTTHDLGFMFWPSYVVGQRLGFLRDDEVTPAFAAARTLAERFNDKGRYIQAFGGVGDPRGAGTSTIDTMMNLPLLWWAGKALGDDRLLEIGHQHARTSSKVFLRPDGSTFHLNRFDPATGELQHQGTFQGSSNDSCWSRGQAWALTGFALAFAATEDQELLAASAAASEYFWAHTPSDYLVPWDFTDGAANSPRDASAVAIAALGELVLSRVDPVEASRHDRRRRATSALHGLAQYTSDDTSTQGILQRSSYSVPHGLGLDGATAWGDFFYPLAYAIAEGHFSIDSVLDTGTPVRTSNE